MEDTETHNNEDEDKEEEKEKEVEAIKESEVFKGIKLVNVYALSEYDVI